MTPHRLSKTFLWAFLLLCMSVCYSAVRVDTLKAAYVYNIVKFVSWPGSIEKLTICVLSRDRLLLEQFNTLHNKQVTGRVIRFHELTELVKLEDIEVCDVLYSDSDHWALAVANEVPGILTVSEKVAGTRGRSVIVFDIIDNRLTFEINMPLLNTKNISISSKLLRLANGIR